MANTGEAAGEQKQVLSDSGKLCGLFVKIKKNQENKTARMLQGQSLSPKVSAQRPLCFINVQQGSGKPWAKWAMLKPMEWERQQ